jgi:hypothetical protein
MPQEPVFTMVGNTCIDLVRSDLSESCGGAGSTSKLASSFEAGALHLEAVVTEATAIIRRLASLEMTAHQGALPSWSSMTMTK